MNELQRTLFDCETNHATNHLLAALDILQQVNRGATRTSLRDKAETALIEMIDSMQRIGVQAR